ncbi:unnamed protein product, partial [Tetraodon nigroviridis]
NSIHWFRKGLRLHDNPVASGGGPRSRHSALCYTSWTHGLQVPLM